MLEETLQAYTYSRRLYVRIRRRLTIRYVNSNSSCRYSRLDVSSRSSRISNSLAEVQPSADCSP
jgi:hypothetical protein